MTIYQQLVEYCERQKQEQKKEVFSSKELRDAMLAKYGTPQNSTLPSDYCYNKINLGISFVQHLFEESQGEYRYRGPNFPYSGTITWKERSGEERAVGRWVNGTFYLWELFRKVNLKFYRPELRPEETRETVQGDATEPVATGMEGQDNQLGLQSPVSTLTAEEQISLPVIVDVQEVQRKDATVSRIIRDTKQAKLIKHLYQHSCQVCRITLSTSAGPYAEAAHIVPLGEPHNGPDALDNILCLCPNHHVLFDYGAFSISESFALLGIHGKLFVDPKHKINKDYLKQHRNRNLKHIHAT